MKTDDKILYAVCNRFHKGSVVKPCRRLIYGTNKTLIRIVLASSIEDAILLSYPNLHTEDWNMLKLRIYAIQSSKVSILKNPKFLQNHFNFPKAVELEEYASLSNLRMESVGLIKIYQQSLKNENLLNEKGEVCGKRYAVF